jgi:hypothetical protein
MLTPVVVDLPLMGEWIVPNTPAKKIPSHGTDMLGQRYAFDFVGIDPRSKSARFYRPSPLQYFFFGVRLQDCFGWGKPIYAAAAGVVVRAEDGWPERELVHPARDISLLFKNAWTLDATNPMDLRPLAGNYIIVETDNGHAVYAHAQTGSIQVSSGDRVTPGQPLARVGHSGNSTAPHLHFHLMDRADPLKAHGIPCCFLPVPNNSR